MKSIIRQPVLNEQTMMHEFKEVDISTIRLQEECVMAIDGSTSCSGVSILNKQGLIMYSIAFIRDRDNETPVQYKVRFKRALLDILLNNKCIKNVYYEEPFWGYAESAKVLMMLRTSVEELIAENEPNLDYLSLTEVNNKKWKKYFLAPDPCPSNSELEKEAVREKLIKLLPVMATVTQDEIDAASMGFVALWKLESHRESDLSSKKKVKAFKYNVKFIGADDISDMLEEFSYMMKDKSWKVPEFLLDNIEFFDLPGKGDFDDYVYKAIGPEDKLVILSFATKHYGNIILQHRLGNLAKNYSKIYAICWRKTRK